MGIRFNMIGIFVTDLQKMVAFCQTVNFLYPTLSIYCRTLMLLRPYTLVPLFSSVVEENNIFRYCYDVTVFWAEDFTNLGAMFARKSI
jgi:hypothetical protein